MKLKTKLPRLRLHIPLVTFLFERLATHTHALRPSWPNSPNHWTTSVNLTKVSSYTITVFYKWQLSDLHGQRVCQPLSIVLTFSLSESFSSLYFCSCSFHCDTCWELSSRAIVRRLLLFFSVCISLSHFFTLVVLVWCVHAVSGMEWCNDDIMMMQYKQEWVNSYSYM